MIALLDGPLLIDTPDASRMSPACLHAQSVEAAILSIHPEAEIISFPVFTGRLTTTRDKVVAAVQQAMASEARVLHCSFGFPDADKNTAAAFEAAVERFDCVIASSPARGSAVFPASYPGVLKASGDARACGSQLAWLNTGTVDFAASASAPEGFSIAGSSIGAARVTGLVSRLLGESINAIELRQLLAARAQFIGPERRVNQ